jgi:hypothetical protein
VRPALELAGVRGGSELGGRWLGAARNVLGGAMLGGLRAARGLLCE